MTTNRNALYMLIAALAIVAAVLGYQLYEAKREPKGVEIKVGPGSISIEKK